MPAPVAASFAARGALSKGVMGKMFGGAAGGGKYAKLEGAQRMRSEIMKKPGVKLGLGLGLIVMLLVVALFVFWIGPTYIWGDSPPPPPPSSPQPSPSPPPETYPDGKDAPNGYKRTSWNKLCGADCEVLRTNDTEGVCYTGRSAWQSCYVEKQSVEQVCNNMPGCGGYKCDQHHTDGGKRKEFCYLLDTESAGQFWTSGRGVSNDGDMYIKKKLE